MMARNDIGKEMTEDIQGSGCVLGSRSGMIDPARSAFYMGFGPVLQAKVILELP